MLCKTRIHLANDDSLYDLVYFTTRVLHERHECDMSAT